MCTVFTVCGQCFPAARFERISAVSFTDTDYTVALRWRSPTWITPRRRISETLLVAENKTGYFCVNLRPGTPKPYQARMKRAGKDVHLGSFATVEEAALCVARSPEGREAAEKAAAAAVPPTRPLTSEEARQQAQAEELTLLKAGNKTGYFGVYLTKPGQPPKPYKVQVIRGGKVVALGRFATAEEAAMCVARSPEGQAAAERAASAAPPLTSEEAREQAQAEGLTLRVAKNKAGYFGVYHQPGRSRPTWRR